MDVEQPEPLPEEGETVSEESEASGDKEEMATKKGPEIEVNRLQRNQKPRLRKR